jgi:epoxyqueuosine reductase
MRPTVQTTAQTATRMHPETTAAALPLTLPAIRQQALALGFADVSVAHFDSLPFASQRLSDWMAQGMHGGMAYLPRNAALRADPTQLLPQARCALLLRMDYLPQAATQLAHSTAQRAQPQQAQVSLYAQGRDYHTVLRSRLKKLVAWMAAQPAQNPLPAPPQFRVFTDSAPVMEVALAQASGLGWRGKHSLLLHREAGSTFFLGGILTTLELPASPPTSSHCGQCTACMDICPTRAIVAPYVVDARRCISYLTIEHEGAIDAGLRPLLGNRIYGCDDCQTACPWNTFTQNAAPSVAGDFAVRNGLDAASLLDLWGWTEAQFLQRTEGSAIRRIGHARWLRNIATALGNALRAQTSLVSPVLPISPESQTPPLSRPLHTDTAQACNAICQALEQHAQHPDAAVREHVAWALAQHFTM